MAVDHYTDMYHDLLVPEMVYEDLDTLRQFMTFFASQVDRSEAGCVSSPPHPSLTMLFHNPDTGENRAHDGCIHEVARRTMGYMARIFDVPAYFRMQSRCESPVSRPFVLALQVDDNFIEGNNGTFLLNISGSTVEVVEHAQPDVTLSADISTLSSLVMGAFSLDEALRLGRLTFSDHGYAADVQRAIGWSPEARELHLFLILSVQAQQGRGGRSPPRPVFVPHRSRKAASATSYSGSPLAAHSSSMPSSCRPAPPDQSRTRKRSSASAPHSGRAARPAGRSGCIARTAPPRWSTPAPGLLQRQKGFQQYPLGWSIGRPAHRLSPLRPWTPPGASVHHKIPACPAHGPSEKAAGPPPPTVPRRAGPIVSVLGQARQASRNRSGKQYSPSRRSTGSSAAVILV